jgi:hypothetical protein
MRNEFRDGLPQGRFPEKDHPLQTGFLDRPHESFGIGIQIRRSRRQLYRLHARAGERLQEFSREQWIPIMDHLIEAVVDPSEPPMPPNVTMKQAGHLLESLVRGEPNFLHAPRHKRQSPVR